MRSQRQIHARARSLGFVHLVKQDGYVYDAWTDKEFELLAKAFIVFGEDYEKLNQVMKMRSTEQIRSKFTTISFQMYVTEFCMQHGLEPMRFRKIARGSKKSNHFDEQNARGIQPHTIVPRLSPPVVDKTAERSLIRDYRATLRSLVPPPFSLQCKMVEQELNPKHRAARPKTFIPPPPPNARMNSDDRRVSSLLPLTMQDLKAAAAKIPGRRPKNEYSDLDLDDHDELMQDELRELDPRHRAARPKSFIFSPPVLPNSRMGGTFSSGGGSMGRGGRGRRVTSSLQATMQYAKAAAAKKPGRRPKNDDSDSDSELMQHGPQELDPRNRAARPKSFMPLPHSPNARMGGNTVDSVSSLHRRGRGRRAASSLPPAIQDSETTAAVAARKFGRRPNNEDSDWELDDNPDEPNKSGVYDEIPRLQAESMTAEELFRRCRETPIVFVSGMTKAMDPNAFDASRLGKLHRDEVVDVLLQYPDSFGYNITRHALGVESLSHYVEYMEHFRENLPGGEPSLDVLRLMVFDKMSGQRTQRECNIQKLTVDPPRSMAGARAANSPKRVRPGRRPVLFCVNVDIGDWPDILKELKKLPSWCRWGLDDVLFRHLPPGMAIPGMTLPQLYFKVPGVWTGGHEENSRFFSINNNHGPGDSIWGAIAKEHAPRLRNAVLEEYDIDIYQTEGRWFPDPAFCNRHGIPLMIGIQRAGDTAILNGATLHWVRSAGFAVNSSWNFGMRIAAQIDSAFERERINYKLNVRNIVPLRCLCLNVLVAAKQSDVSVSSYDECEVEFLETVASHVRESLTLEIEYEEAIEEMVSVNAAVNTAAIMAGSMAAPFPLFEYVVEPVDSLVALCDGCWAEIFIHYSACESCALDNVDEGVEADLDLAKHVFFCIPCTKKHIQAHPKHAMEFRFKVIEQDETCIRDWLIALDEFMIRVNAAKQVGDLASSATTPSLQVDGDDL